MHGVTIPPSIILLYFPILTIIEHPPPPLTPPHAPPIMFLVLPFFWIWPIFTIKLIPCNIILLLFLPFHFLPILTRSCPLSIALFFVTHSPYLCVHLFSLSISIPFSLSLSVSLTALLSPLSSNSFILPIYVSPYLSLSLTHTHSPYLYISPFFSLSF